MDNLFKLIYKQKPIFVRLITLLLFRSQFNMIFVDTQFRLYEPQRYHARDARWIKLVTHILSWVNRLQFGVTALKQIEKYTYGQDFVLTARKF